MVNIYSEISMCTMNQSSRLHVLPPFFFLFTTLKLQSGCAGLGAALTTSAIETGFAWLLPDDPALLTREAASLFRLLMYSAAKRRPSSVVLLV